MNSSNPNYVTSTQHNSPIEVGQVYAVWVNGQQITARLISLSRNGKSGTFASDGDNACSFLASVKSIIRLA